MSTATDTHSDSHSADGHTAHGEHKSDMFYVKIALALAAITAAEVALSYMDVGALFLPTLLILMAVKFVMVVLFFMHLRYDGKWFNMAFWSGLILAMIVYLVALFTFHVFGN
jgi:cytochrome c oxidase subunit IV